MILDNKYLYIEQLGIGGFGNVFLAEDILSKRKVAIKRLKFSNAATTKFFIKEIEKISKFEHPNIVKYYHYFIENKILHLVMEYCSGGSLSDRIHLKNYSQEKGIEWVIKLANALRAVNKIGIIHRDIRPVNILFDKNGEIKLSDFGIANQKFGVLAYFYPDEHGGVFVNDPTIDIYALGVTLIEILTFKNPFSFKNKKEIVEIHKIKDFGISKLPNWVQNVIEKAINKDKIKRFQFMIQFEEALKSQHSPILFDKKFILSSKYSEEGLKFLKNNKLKKAKVNIDLGLSFQENNIVANKALGLYFLNMNDLTNARKQIEKTLKINPRINLHFELGWLELEIKKYDKALSLISDYLIRNPLDAQAYILLLRTYIETCKFETAYELLKSIENVIQIPFEIIQNIELICRFKLGLEYSIDLVDSIHPFMQFNIDLIKYLESNSRNNCTYNFLFIDTQLLFQENHKLFLDIGTEKYEIDDSLVVLELDIDDNLRVNQRSFKSRDLIIITNFKDNIWIYPYSSKLIYIDGRVVNHKMLINHSVDVSFSIHNIKVSFDTWKLF